MKLATPRGHEVRPILDRVRESLFSILQRDIEGVRVADLFAGTGVIGLEALSRGADSCTFIDRDLACVSTIKDNITRARRESQSRVLKADAFEAAELLPESGACGLIFVDPPYRLLRQDRTHDKIVRLVESLAVPAVLAEDGIVVVRVPAESDMPGHIDPLVQYDRRPYGGMKICFFKYAK